MSSQGGRDGKGTLSQKRRKIQRKQLKQAYEQYRCNEDWNERGRGDHRNHLLGLDWRMDKKGGGRR